MGFIAPVLAVAGGVMSYMGAQQSAKATEAVGRQAELRGQYEADNILAEGTENIFRQQTTNQERLAALRAQTGSGGGVFSGSSIDVFTKSSSRLALEVSDSVRAQNIAATARRQAGAMTGFEAKTSASAQRMQGTASLLSGFASAASSFGGGSSSPKLTSLY